MASVISHVIYADRYLKNYPGINNTQEFMLGVSFPDIRRVSNVARAQTHNCFEDLDLYFEKLSAFEAGWKFHVWCDLRRSELLRDKDFFEIDEVKDSYYFSNYLLEDQLLWDEYNNWETLVNYFNNAAFVDLFEELDESDWSFWFEMLAEYIQKKPDKKSTQKFLKKIPSFAGKADHLLEEIEQLEAEKEIAEILQNLHEEML